MVRYELGGSAQLNAEQVGPGEFASAVGIASVVAPAQRVVEAQTKPALSQSPIVWMMHTGSVHEIRLEFGIRPKLTAKGLRSSSTSTSKRGTITDIFGVCRTNGETHPLHHRPQAVHVLCCGEYVCDQIVPTTQSSCRLDSAEIETHMTTHLLDLARSSLFKTSALTTNTAKNDFFRRN